MVGYIIPAWLFRWVFDGFTTSLERKAFEVFLSEPTLLHFFRFLLLACKQPGVHAFTFAGICCMMMTLETGADCSISLAFVWFNGPLTLNMGQFLGHITAPSISSSAPLL
jgi:hypothetical protein